MNIQFRRHGRPDDALAQGYAIYRQRTQNPCPGCGNSQWLIGRSMAECAFCETALPLEKSFRFTGLSVA